MDALSADAEKAAHRGNTKAVLAIAARLRTKQFRRPAVSLAFKDGAFATSPLCVAKRWQEHWGEVLGASTACLDDLLVQPIPKVSEDTLLPPPAEVIESALAKLKSRATGEDQLPATLLKQARKVVAPLLHARWADICKHNVVPMQMKGGQLISLWKKKETITSCSSYRGVLIENQRGKPFSQWLRKRRYPFFCEYTGDTQHGGNKHRTTDFVHHTARAALAWAQQASQSIAFIFLDLTSAFDAICRELGFGTSDEYFAKASSRLGLCADEFKLLRDFVLSGGSAFTEAGIDPATVALVKEYHNSTWLSTEGLSDVLVADRGTRPGNAVADLLFAASFAKVRHVCIQTLKDSGPASSLPFTPHRLYEEPLVESADLSDIAFVDDQLFFVTSNVAGDLESIIALAIDKEWSVGRRNVGLINV